jgi:hypothetical protein
MKEYITDKMGKIDALRENTELSGEAKERSIKEITDRLRGIGYNPQFQNKKRSPFLRANPLDTRKMPPSKASVKASAAAKAIASTNALQARQSSEEAYQDFSGSSSVSNTVTSNPTGDPNISIIDRINHLNHIISALIPFYDGVEEKESIAMLKQKLESLRLDDPEGILSDLRNTTFKTFLDSHKIHFQQLNDKLERLKETNSGFVVRKQQFQKTISDKFMEIINTIGNFSADNSTIEKAIESNPDFKQVYRGKTVGGGDFKKLKSNKTRKDRWIRRLLQQLKKV